MNMKNQKGFTLIELLVVVGIIGILSGIAIPQFSEYRKRAFDSRALSDLRNIALGEESYYLDNERYLSCDGSACNALPGITSLSSGVSLSIAASTTSFTGTASHSKGTGKVFRWDSNSGGMQAS